MIKRATAICDGQKISIESLYQVIDGKQINKPDVLEYLRAKSQNKELFCPCQCGSNLILVAGNKNKVAQHFRIDNKDQERHCIIEESGEDAAYSSFTIKRWIESKSEIPISFRYIHEQVNLKADEFIKSDLSKHETQTLYFVGKNNECNEGQFPEGLYSIQNRQGFILFMYPQNEEDCEAKVKTVIYEKNLKELWEQILIADDVLSKYSIDSSGNVTYRSERIIDLVKKIHTNYVNKRESCREEFEKTAFYTPTKHKYIKLPKSMEEIREDNRRMQEQYEKERKLKRIKSE